MPTTKVIRYTTTPASAGDNERLVRAVFAELDSDQPAGVHYTALRLDGSDNFMHLVTFDSDDNPLARSEAFAAFQAGIGQRCVEVPTATDATVVGTYSPTASSKT
jgi:hypothetical protein